MSYRLFLDDLRDPPLDSGEWQVARSTMAAKLLVHQLGMPTFISFDHDLGGDDTAMAFINWLVSRSLDELDAGTMVAPISFTVHSQNPVGAVNIAGLMTSFNRFLEQQRVGS
jgi:hypothetical protein